MKISPHSESLVEDPQTSASVSLVLFLDLELLTELSSLVNAIDRERGKLHEVFEPSFDWKECIGEKFIEQKLNYIHENPCQEHWKLAANPVDYIHSSANFYINGKQGEYPLTSYSELEDIDLSTLSE